MNSRNLTFLKGREKIHNFVVMNDGSSLDDCSGVIDSTSSVKKRGGVYGGCRPALETDDAIGANNCKLHPNDVKLFFVSPDEKSVISSAADGIKDISNHRLARPLAVKYPSEDIGIVAGTDPGGPRSKYGAFNQDNIAFSPKDRVACIADGVGGYGRNSAAVSRLMSVAVVEALSGGNQPLFDRKVLEEIRRCASLRDANVPVGGSCVLGARIGEKRIDLLSIGDSEAIIVGKNGEMKFHMPPNNRAYEKLAGFSSNTPEALRSLPSLPELGEEVVERYGIYWRDRDKIWLRDGHGLTTELGAFNYRNIDKVSVDIRSAPFEDGDVFLAGSDGLFGIISPFEAAHIVAGLDAVAAYKMLLTFIYKAWEGKWASCFSGRRLDGTLVSPEDLKGNFFDNISILVACKGLSAVEESAGVDDICRNVGIAIGNV